MANSRLRFLLAIATGAAGLMLAGCVNFSAIDDLKDAQPTGTAFDQALFKNYVFLARSFGDVGASSYTTFDQIGSLSLSETDSDIAGLANTFASKALQLSRGEAVDPVPGINAKSHALRDRLVRALTPGRDTFPRDAARAQADYDCWNLNAAVASQANAAAQCEQSLTVTLARLENEVHNDAGAAAPTPAPQPTASATDSSAPDAAPAAAPTPPPQSSAAPQPSAQLAGSNVYFGFDSWMLTADDMRVIEDTIDTARAGGQPKIYVVGHTDTSGNADYNMHLSIKRADVVRDALVDLGARREAIETKGVGETDLAVATPDGVRDGKNRRSVLMLGI